MEKCSVCGKDAAFEDADLNEFSGEVRCYFVCEQGHVGMHSHDASEKESEHLRSVQRLAVTRALARILRKLGLIVK